MSEISDVAITLFNICRIRKAVRISERACVEHLSQVLYQWYRIQAYVYEPQISIYLYVARLLMAQHVTNMLQQKYRSATLLRYMLVGIT